ncbi:MAG: hypothetical protein M3347_00280 [Armatimonadota bacterium]|nr:hypothetical protein [Armatimonadota bacterium]
MTLRPVNGVTVSLGGRDSTDYYGLAAPTTALVICRPTPVNVIHMIAICITAIRMNAIYRGAAVGSGVARRAICPRT